MLKPTSMKLCIFIGVNVGGVVGWWLGEMAGPLTAWFASGAGSILGVYAGWKFTKSCLE